MSTTSTLHRGWAFTLLLALALMISVAAPALASDTFNVSVYHGINGRSLGLEKELPVNVFVYKDGAHLATIEDFRFKDRFEAPLPAGEYLIMVELTDGTPLPTMTLGPVEIPAGAEVSIHAKLGAGKAPILKAMVR